jgi:proteasome lid subunit RPN8/RPN11
MTRRRIEPDPDRAPAVVPADVLNEVFAHAREAAPEECCGLITGDGREPWRHVVRCRNDMTLHHRRDPEAYPRDGREGFYMNEQDYVRAEDEAEARGERITCVYHSHVGCGAWFSELDQEFAEQPLFPFPDASHLVLSVVGGKVVDQALFVRENAKPSGSSDAKPSGSSDASFVGRPVVHGRW